MSGLPPGAPTGDGALETHSAQFAALYDELHQVAQRELRRSGGLGVSATTILHEAYFKVQQRALQGRDLLNP